MPKYDDKQIFAIEQQIRKKYGDETAINFSSLWTLEKEKEYLEQVKKVNKKLFENDKKMILDNGYYINKNILDKGSFKVCPYCNSQSLKNKDELYMTKFNCCYKCYILNIESREGKENNV